MTREGADIFRERLLECFDQYKDKAVRLERLQLSESSSDEREFWLECHARRYVIDHILAGTGWQIFADRDLGGHSQNLGIEIGLKSLATGQRRFLDYLGFERETAVPLLVVEAKRPSLALPAEGNWTGHFASHPVGNLFAEFLQALDGSDDEAGRLESPLTEEWRKNLYSLRDYIRSIDPDSLPQRVLITNGYWLVIFDDPKSAFVDPEATVSPRDILIYDNPIAILQFYDDIYQRISYGHLARDHGIVTPHQACPLISAADVSYAMFGLRVLYCRDQTLYTRIPRIEIAPVVHLCSRSGTFISIEAAEGNGFEFALRDDEHVNAQRDEVARAAHTLKEQIERELGLTGPIPLRDISSHYVDTGAFEKLPGLRRLNEGTASAQEFVLVTGSCPHFLVDPTTHRECRFHNCGDAQREGVLYEIGPVLDPAISPKSFFADGSCFHCSHQQTYRSKILELTAVSRDRTGPRSGRDGEAFCEIVEIDEALCCRSCVFYETCAKSEMFRLPCQ